MKREQHIRIVALIQDWFRVNQRQLPWRETYEPYHVWVSEIMLQQTQVSKVVPYFLRFIKRFPSLEILAESEEHDVLLLWSGLGYYSRARNLLKGARYVVSELGGRIPDDVDSLIQIPGIGRYAAGAISGIAFEKPAPVVDGNVKRVLARIFAIKEDVSKGSGLKHIWDLAEKLVVLSDPRDFNQGMMELGALICLPRNPLCKQCPACDICKARIQGMQDTLPMPKKRPKTVRRKEIFLLFTRGNKVLIAKRRSGIPYEGMWEFPRVTVKSFSKTRSILKQMGIEAETSKVLHEIQYSIMNYRVTARFLSACEEINPLDLGLYEKSMWARIPDLTQYPMPGPVKKFIEDISVSSLRAES